MIIAIDGPAASGKSTIAKAVARKLGFDYLDTGAMYRAITWKALETKTDISDEKSLGKLASSSELTLSKPKEGALVVFVDGEDVSEAIRNPKVSAAVSAVSKVPAVRVELVKKQRALARSGKNLMAEGRDIGTVVFPDAELKIFLTASTEERSKRRHKELLEKGYEVDLKKVEKDIIARDKYDSTRETSPLIKASDAINLDTTAKTIEQVVDEVVAMVEKRAGSGS